MPRLIWGKNPKDQEMITQREANRRELAVMSLEDIATELSGLRQNLEEIKTSSNTMYES